jgi:myo-inositol-1(or 4)-monophosphatase
MRGSKELKAAKDVAREAGDLLMSYYGKIHVKYKDDRSVVTEADIESEKLIKSTLEAEFPDYSFLGEESGLDEKDGDHLWVVDPLDGTTNYMIQNPFFCVSIGLVRKGEPIIGVVYYPFVDELFSAEVEKGAYLNSKRIYVSKKERLEDSVVSFCNNRGETAIRRMANIFLDVKLVTNKLRQFGAGGLEMSYVACGRTESFMMPNTNLWDVAAGTAIVREAGGRVTDFNGNPYNMESLDILATNGSIHEAMLQILRDK